MPIIEWPGFAGREVRESSGHQAETPEGTVHYKIRWRSCVAYVWVPAEHHCTDAAWWANRSMEPYSSVPDRQQIQWNITSWLGSPDPGKRFVKIWGHRKIHQRSIIHYEFAKSASLWARRLDSITKWEYGSCVTTVPRPSKCESRVCKSCSEKHNTLLHEQQHHHHQQEKWFHLW